MNEFDNIFDLVPQELHDLEELRAQTKVYEDKVRQDNFETPQDRLESRRDLLSHLRNEWAVGTDDEVQDRVAKIGRLSVQKLIETRVGSVLEDAELSEEARIEDAASAHWFKQTFDFIQRYGARTVELQDFKKNQLQVKLGRDVQQEYSENPWTELLKQQDVGIKVDRHYIIGSDGNLTRISDDLSVTDSQLESNRRRMLLAVIESDDSLNLRQLFTHFFGAEERYSSNKILPHVEWMKTIPMGEEKLVMSYEDNNGNVCLQTSPNFEVEVEEVDLEEPDTTGDDITDEQINSKMESTRKQLQNVNLITHYLSGYNDVLDAYGFEPISQEMLSELETHIPKLERGVELERLRKVAIDEILQDTSTNESLVELVYSINGVSREDHDLVASAASRFLLMLEKVKGRELLAVLAGSKWDITETLKDGSLERDRRLLDSSKREIWPKMAPELINK